MTPKLQGNNAETDAQRDIGYWKKMEVSRLEGRAVDNIPVEVMQHVFHHLGPKDFNSARHVCSKWMRASLDASLLTLMLKRGGWWSGIERKWQATSASEATPAITASTEPDVWFLSCLLARECALSSGWTGNGLCVSKRNALVECAHVDFKELAEGPPLSDGSHSAKLVFTASSCGKFLLVAGGGIIYVYELIGSIIRAWTTIICPRQVVAMSMDASSHPFSVAVLLDGRMGLVCSLDHGMHPKSGVSNDDSDVNNRASSYLPLQKDNSISLSKDGARTYLTPTANGYTPDQLPGFSHLEIQSASELVGLRGCDDHRRHDRNLIVSEWSPLRFHTSHRKTGRTPSPPSSLPIDTGHRVIYRNVCRADDPPRSVATSPQRRCVAFGSASGVELHWHDSATGQALSRWFALAAPSDALHFVPPRAGIDAARKLRLVSSAAHATRRAARCPPAQRFPAAPVDYFGAAPLADGFHALFCDAASGLLCLGDGGRAALGGPARLRRKVVLWAGEAGPWPAPALYAAAEDGRGAVRVVAVYGDALVLYSVPSDVLAWSRSGLRRREGELEEEGVSLEEWVGWWPDGDFPFEVRCARDARGCPASVWPLLLQGTTIGRLEGVMDVAVSDSDELCVWAFTGDGRAVAWKVDNGYQSLVKSKVACGGHVLDLYELDADDDVIMKDVHDDHRAGYPTICSSTVIPRALAIENNEDIDMVQIYGAALFDEDGDIVMTGSGCT